MRSAASVQAQLGHMAGGGREVLQDRTRSWTAPALMQPLDLRPSAWPSSEAAAGCVDAHAAGHLVVRAQGPRRSPEGCGDGAGRVTARRLIAVSERFGPASRRLLCRLSCPHFTFFSERATGATKQAAKAGNCRHELLKRTRWRYELLKRTRWRWSPRQSPGGKAE